MERLLTLYSEVQSTDVRWLWYPFIAIGKITLLQGDPGDGKSTMMMNLIAELSTGGKTPDGCKNWCAAKSDLSVLRGWRFRHDKAPSWNVVEQTAGRLLSSMKKFITALHWTMSVSVRQSLNFGLDWS